MIALYWKLVIIKESDKTFSPYYLIKVSCDNTWNFMVFCLDHYNLSGTRQVRDLEKSRKIGIQPNLKSHHLGESSYFLAGGVH